jgi:hypothetical protein
VSYTSGLLGFEFVRHLWDRTTQEFISTDAGEMRLPCRHGLLNLPHQPVSGTAVIGGRTYTVRATKTSNFCRGCRVEVDAMTNRVWPVSAITGGGVTTTFQDVYASAGWDLSLAVDEVNVPEDASLTIAELQTLIATHHSPGAAGEWRLWLLAGSSQGTLFGIMFDQDQVPREGAVGFADATLGNVPVIEANARNKPLDEVPAAFLRTLVHEAGHALNLFHPKHDVHNPPSGTEIMNQTGDVMGFATVANPTPAMRHSASRTTTTPPWCTHPIRRCARAGNRSAGVMALSPRAFPSRPMPKAWSTPTMQPGCSWSLSCPRMCISASMSSRK